MEQKNLKNEKAKYIIENINNFLLNKEEINFKLKETRTGTYFKGKKYQLINSTGSKSSNYFTLNEIEAINDFINFLN